MAAVTSCENTLLIVFTDVLSGYVKILETKEILYIRKDNPNGTFSLHQHDRCFIVLYINMAAVKS